MKYHQYLRFPSLVLFVWNHDDRYLSGNFNSNGQYKKNYWSSNNNNKISIIFIHWHSKLTNYNLIWKNVRHSYEKICSREMLTDSLDDLLPLHKLSETHRDSFILRGKQRWGQFELMHLLWEFGCSDRSIILKDS